MAAGSNEAGTVRAGARRGLFLVLEGIEGSGKTTQARLLADWLAARRIPCLLTREPGGTPIGEEIRRLLLDSDNVAPRAELLLMLAARAALLEARVLPALRAGEIVIADRFELSTLAYQGGGRELPSDEIRHINRFATDGLRPDLTILLDVPQDAGEARRQATRAQQDRIERAGRAFHDRVSAAYRLLADEQGVAVVDGTDAVEVVHQRVRELLERRFPETFAVAPG